MRFGIIGGGSWATALAKILTDRRHTINWWMRSETAIRHLGQRHHNPHYLSSVYFDSALLRLSGDIQTVFRDSEVLVIAVPSAYAADTLESLTPAHWRDKKVVSAIKGMLPDSNVLLNEYLGEHFRVALQDYFAVLGPCHAEEVAAEKLSYLTFSGIDLQAASAIAAEFNNDYINTVVNHDILGVQYAAVMKNIYALGAGIAHGLDYGDNFLSVYIANAADEMAGFLKRFGAEHITVGEHSGEEDPITHRKSPNYAASVYLGDLLVTCYSLHSRNRMLGTMVGKGYSVKAAQLEMNMVAEGINASRSMYSLNQTLQASIPIAEAIYRIVWENLKPAEGFRKIEGVLV